MRSYYMAPLSLSRYRGVLDKAGVYNFANALESLKSGAQARKDTASVIGWDTIWIETSLSFADYTPGLLSSRFAAFTLESLA